MKPMKAYGKTPDLHDLKYPQLASPKFDGIRAVIKGGVALSNSLKPIPNLSVQAWAKKYEHKLEGFDGELMVHGDFNDVQSVIMSVYGGNEWTFHAFDLWDMPAMPFITRVAILSEKPFVDSIPQLKLVPHSKIHTPEGLDALWDYCLEAGYEGVITRDPYGPYKYGRSTLKQGWMIKLKKWDDDEAAIIGYEELMHNTNEAFTGELGQTKRAKHQAGMVTSGLLGSVTVQWQGKTFSIGGGPGLTTSERARLWQAKEALPGKLLSFKYFGVSKLGIPRHPNWKGLRYDV